MAILSKKFFLLSFMGLLLLILTPHTAAQAVPTLTIPSELAGTPGTLVRIPVDFKAAGNPIRNIVFSIDYDEAVFTFNSFECALESSGTPIPCDASFDTGDTDSEVDVVIGRTTPPLLSVPEGEIMTLVLDINPDAVPDTTAPVAFSTEPLPSFGNNLGQSVSGQGIDGSVILGANTDPIANADVAATDEDVPVVIDVLANDTDTDGDTLSIENVSQPAHGIVANNGSDIFYAPNANFNGKDEFDYTISDGHGGSATASVTVTINSVNDTPTLTISTEPIETDEGTTILRTLIAADVDGDVLIVEAALGTVVDLGGGNYEWSYFADDGPATTGITITVSDGHDGAADATFDLTVNNVAPTASFANETGLITAPGIATLTFSSPMDVSSADTTTGFLYSYDCTNSGTFLVSQSTSTSFNCPYNVPGNYTARGRIADKDGGYTDLLAQVDVQAPANVAPVVSAGNDQVITLPTSSVSLAGSASDDGLPLPSNLTYTWSGPAGVTFGTPNTASTSASFSGAGTYDLLLTVSDGELSGSDTVQILVKPAQNVAPVANAGLDQTVQDTAPYGNQDVILDGSGSTDGDGSIAKYVWTEGASVLAEVVKPTVNLTDGTHYITLTVTDNNGATATDEVIVMVQLPANQAPVVNAGADQNITLPTNSVALTGSVTDDGLPLPPALTYTWSGPAGVTFSAPNALSTNATFSAAGTYTLQLTVSDGQLSGSDTLQVVVSPQNNTNTTVTNQVNQSSDDVNEDGSSYDATNPLLWLGTGQSTSKSFTGLRFTNLEIPQGATITEAHIEVYTPTSQWINMRILIGAEAVDNSPTFTSSTRPSTRAFTGARLDYRSNTPWMAGTWNNTVDVKAIVQEIVNRPGWHSGNSLSMLIKGLGSQWGRKFFSSFDGDPTHAPKLVISYAGGLPPPNQPPVIQLDNPSASASAAEGQPATVITGTFGDPDNNPITLSASVGTVQSNGNTWTWSYTPPDGPLSQTVTITAQDSKGAFATTPVTFGLTVTDVAPTAIFAAQPLSTFPNNPVTLTFSSPVDVAADLPGLIYSFDCGNGSTQTSASPQFSCIYGSIGTFTVLGRVTDKDGGYTDYQATITVSDTPTEPTTISPQVNGSSDDVNENGASFQVNNSTVWVGTEGNSNQSYTGLRFNSLSIPAGATITEAHLEFYVTSNQWISVDALIAAEAADNSQTFSSGSRPSGRPFTTNRVEHHSNELWSANTWNTLTGNLSGVVQEVVSRGGWQSGNSLSIILKGIGSKFGRKFVTSYDGNPAFAPRLVIHYTVPSVPPVPPPPTVPEIVPPTAGFTSDVTSGIAPLTVIFTNLSTGDIAGYAWDFGDGNSSTDTNPVHSYNAAGTYTITLIVGGVDGTASVAQSIITVNDPPPIETPETTPPPTDEVVSPPPSEETPLEQPIEQLPASP